MTNTPRPLIGCDTETERFGPCQLAPPIVCMSACLQYDQSKVQNYDDIPQKLAVVADAGSIEALFNAVTIGAHDIAFHNAAFDLAVLANHNPAWITQIFDMLTQGWIHCTIIREKLLNLTSQGDLKFIELPDGSKQRIEYKLDALIRQRFGVDLSETKKGDDAWRTNYAVLKDMSLDLDQWPQDAVTYALDDARWALHLCEDQEQRRQAQIAETGIDPFETEAFQTTVDFCLFLMSCWGMAVDADEKARIEAMLAEELSPEHLAGLVASGILRPGRPAQPHAKGAKDHVEGCPKKWKDSTGQKVECNCPVKMSDGVEPSINTGVLKEYVIKLSQENPAVQIVKTAPSKKFPEGQISVTEEWLARFAAFDPILAEYQHRSALLKLVTTEMPRLNWEGKTAEVVHPCYDVLKETGRTSSYASDSYPSFNCQNVDPRARGCYVPRPGNLLFSIDYSQMELGTLAQTIIRLFGGSTLADQINNDIDPHAYLGAQLCFALNDDFRAACEDEAANDQGNQIYPIFSQCEKSSNDAVRALFKHFRKLAKPTGLGYPGGLGPETFIAYAKGTFGVEVDLATATNLREIWRKTYPEMVSYFEFINTRCEDARNSPKTKIDDATGQRYSAKQYAYRSPMGMYRAACDYCAAANGLGLQTPSAEGAKLAVINVVRACYDPSLESILLADDKGPTVRPICFIHDEIVGEIRNDDLVQERLDIMCGLMVESMRVITPDVKASAKAAIMERWNKDAEPVYDDQGRLQIWRPKQ